MVPPSLVVCLLDLFEVAVLQGQKGEGKEGKSGTSNPLAFDVVLQHL